MADVQFYPSLRIAPRSDCGYWTVRDYLDAKQQNDWEKMVGILQDRVNFRYFKALKETIDADNQQSTLW